jgi:hypothetical protein
MSTAQPNTSQKPFQVLFPDGTIFKGEASLVMQGDQAVLQPIGKVKRERPSNAKLRRQLRDPTLSRAARISIYETLQYRKRATRGR